MLKPMSSASPAYSTSSSSCASSCSALEHTIFRLPVAEHPAHAAELLVGQDRGALQRLAQRLALDLRAGSCGPGRDDPRVVGKLAVDQLRYELDRAEAEARPASRTARSLTSSSVSREQLRELEHGLARHDHFLPRHVGVELERGEREPVPVGGHHLEAAVLDHHEQPVQVVADVLLRHRVLHERQAAAAAPFARSVKRADSPAGRARRGKSSAGSVCSVEAALAGSHQQPLVLLLQRHLASFRQRAQDVEQLARADGDRARFGARRQGRCAR